MWILRLDMTDQSYRLEPVPEAYELLGGRGLTSNIVHDEVPPLAHPLGPNNKLIFAPGLLTGTTAPTSARLSVGAKSPLTGGIKEANVGAAFAADLARLGIRAMIVEGQPQEKGSYWTAAISWDADSKQPQVAFSPADEYANQSLYDTFPQINEAFGGKTQIAGTGIAGELGYGNSGIAFGDPHGNPTRYAGRGGMGAVMGSKGLKFVVLDAAGAPRREVANKELFEIYKEAGYYPD